MKMEIILDDAKCRIIKMIDEHCWDIIKDLLNDINESSDKKNSTSIKDIEITLDTIKNVQRYKERVDEEIKNVNTLNEILEICKDDLIIESEIDIISAFFGCEIKIKI